VTANRPAIGAVGPNDGGAHAERDGHSSPSLDAILGEIGLAVEPVSESGLLAPAVGIGVSGGSIISLPHDTPGAAGGPSAESFRSGVAQASPVAVAGLVVNAGSALVVVMVAHLVTARSYGAIAQLLGLFFILSMPGSAVLVGVVRRVTALRKIGHGDRVHRWVASVHRIVLAALALEIVIVWILQGWIARELSLPNDQGVLTILAASGVWILLSVDRGLLQAHRDYRALAVNLLMEGSVKAVCVIGLVAIGMGVSGYALGIFVSELVATVHARWLASRAWPASTSISASVSTSAPIPADTLAAGADVDESSVRDRAPGSSEAVRRVLIADVSAAFIGLALLGLLQNVDVILLGRLDHQNAGAYAAISVASKALVFGALALGAYLLPEATIRWNEGGHAVRQLVVTLTFLAVPALVLLGIALFIPSWFLSLIFTAKLSSAAPAFASLVVAMIFLCISVLLTNYLFGVGRRWIVLLLLIGSIAGVVSVAGAHGQPAATARADLIVQAGLAAAMVAAFVIIHHREHGNRWFRIQAPHENLPAPEAGRSA
jgi:O-antigen/teichoic acid export membrane protein